MPLILDVSRNIAEIGFLTAMLGNSVLIYLTGWMTKQIRGTYKYMIIIFAGFGLAFSLVEMLARPFVHSYNGAFVYFSLAKEISGMINIVTFLLALYAGLYATLISFVAVQFMYRYWVLINQDLLMVLFAGWRVLIWVVYALIFGALWVFLCFFCGRFDTYSMVYIRDEMMSVYDMNITEIAGVVIVAYEPDPVDKSNVHLRKSSAFFWCGTIFILFFQYIIVVFCGTSMHFSMAEKLKNFSLVHQRLQKQFFKTLICQISVPTVLFHMPIVPVLTAPFLNLEISFQSGIIYSLFSLYPPIDSFILMYIVSDYRNALSKLASRNRQVYTGSAIMTSQVGIQMS
ncbi:unnamed protein product [Caenorhabditis sp. 36 PRJEB53466]|nr:unnamed protein product [Caenorhabditis sp. 36 PRJEB53466]